MIGGDFNEILRGDEKEGGVIRAGSAMDRFRKVVDSCNLLDMGFSGSKFTWCNRQFGGNVIWERLDRCFCSRFHFEQAWVDDVECRELVQKACGLGLGSNHMSNLQNSLSAVAVNLGDWNRKKKRASLAELRSLKEELEALYGRSRDMGAADRILTVEHQIDDINDRMEQYWRQRSRALWLKKGDRNTRLNKLKVGFFVDRLSWVFNGSGKDSAAIFLLAAWFVWNLKNQTIHGGKVLHSGCLWSRASNYFSDSQSASVSFRSSSLAPK
ncbi:hypothetical protein ACOSQ4_000868 [Xanthoceras sorbifolium]